MEVFISCIRTKQGVRPNTREIPVHLVLEGNVLVVREFWGANYAVTNPIREIASITIYQKDGELKATIWKPEMNDYTFVIPEQHKALILSRANAIVQMEEEIEVEYSLDEKTITANDGMPRHMTSVIPILDWTLVDNTFLIRTASKLIELSF